MKKQTPEPVKFDSRICFSIAYFTNEADAMAYATSPEHQWDRYNGGYFDGMPCGRDSKFDHVDVTLGQLYAVTTA